MTIETVKNDGSLTLKLTGRLDTVTAPQLEEKIREEIGGVTDLSIDMEALEYISSAGLRVILMAQKTMNQQGSMTITHVNSTIQEIFDVTGFSGILNIQ